MHDFALVGKWHQPLVSYHLDGSKYYVPEAKRVIRGKISQPFFSNIYESPIFHHEKDEINPTKLLPVDLTLPPLTKEQRKTVKLWRTVKKLQNVLSFSLYTKGTPDQWNPETPDKVIAEVLTILERRK